MKVKNIQNTRFLPGQPPHPFPLCLSLLLAFQATSLPAKSTHHLFFLLLLSTNECPLATTLFCPSLSSPRRNKSWPRFLAAPAARCSTRATHTWMSHSSPTQAFMSLCFQTTKPLFHRQLYGQTLESKQLGRNQARPLLPCIVFSPPAFVLAHVADKHSASIWLAIFHARPPCFFA